MSFSDLPTELYDAILSHISSSDLQRTVFAVTRAAPLLPIPLQHLYECIRITHPEKAALLYRSLRRHHDHPGRWVKELSIESWTVDADIVVNLMQFIPNLRSLNLWVGPNNFAPEHLEELFSKPILSLRYLALRFRPYVDKATYYQFLKGAYFDSTLVALSCWPPSELPTVSIVQDPLDPSKLANKSFAQPLVFFRLDLAVLLKSAAISSSLRSLRIRIPLRPVARSLCNAATPTPSGNLEDILALPNLEFLDLSTCGVLESELDMILVRFKALKHLVLDNCSLLRGELREGEANALGKRCALVGTRRAKEREKTLKAWLESKEAALADGSTPLHLETAGRRAPKKGRKGLSTATISFRDPPPVASSSNMQASLPARFTQAVTISSTATNESGMDARGVVSASKLYQSTLTSRPGARPEPPRISRIPRIRVLPCLPSLTSLSMNLSSSVKPDRFPAIRNEFEEGWAEGIAQLSVTRARLRTSAGNGYRVMRTISTDPVDYDEDDDEEGLYGLEDVDRTDPEAFGMGDGDGCQKPPIICFSGPGREGNHEDNCSHSIAWDVMKDEM